MHSLGVIISFSNEKIYIKHTLPRMKSSFTSWSNNDGGSLCAHPSYEATYGP